MKLLSLILALSTAWAQVYPGMRTSININALNNLKSKYIPQILNNLTSAPIPSESFSFLALIIPCKLTLTNIIISDASVNMTGTEFSVSAEENLIYLKISSLSMKVSADFKYNYPIFSSGSLEADFNGTDLTIPLKLYVEKGVLKSKLYSTDMDRDKVSIELRPDGIISQTFGFLFKYWPLHSLAQYFYKSAIEKLSASYDGSLKALLNTIQYNQDYTRLPISTDFHFLNMTMNPSGIVFYQNASFYLTNNPLYVSPVVAPSFLPDFATKNTLRIQFTEYFFNSMLWSMFASNSLNLIIQSSQVPKSFPFVFTTTGLNKLVPGLSTIYGPNVPVDLQCSVYKIPDVNIQSAVSVFMSFYCDFVVMISPSAGTAAFRLLGRVSTSFVGELQNLNDKVYLFGSFNEDKTTFDSFTITNSNVGNFSPSGLQQAFNWQAYYLVIQGNKVFEGQGIEVPLPAGITLVNPDIEIYSGALEIGAEAYF